MQIIEISKVKKIIHVLVCIAIVLVLFIGARKKNDVNFELVLDENLQGDITDKKNLEIDQDGKRLFQVFQNETLGIICQYDVTNDECLKELTIFISTKLKGITRTKNMIEYDYATNHLQFSPGESYLVENETEKTDLNFSNLEHGVIEWKINKDVFAGENTVLTVLSFYPISPKDISMQELAQLIYSFRYMRCGYF